MIGCLVSSLIVVACGGFMAGLILPGVLGKRVRVWSFCVFGAAFVPSVIAVLLRDVWQQLTRSPWAMVTGIAVLALLSGVAFAILELRRYVTTPPNAKARRIVEKKPVAPPSGDDDFLRILRDRLRNDEPEDRNE